MRPAVTEPCPAIATISLLLPQTLPAKPKPDAKLQPKLRPQLKGIPTYLSPPQSTRSFIPAEPGDRMPAPAETIVSGVANESMVDLMAGSPDGPPYGFPCPVPTESLMDAMREPIAANDMNGEAIAAQQEMPRYNTSPLPSATLKYAVKALHDGNMVYDSGQIFWHSDGQSYSIQGEASILFFTLQDFQSQGAVDEHRISSVLYTQKRFRKLATNTHFHRERALISFSASTLQHPRQGGEQDRANLVWQLATISRTDPSQFVGRQDIPIQVAGCATFKAGATNPGRGRSGNWRWETHDLARRPPAAAMLSRAAAGYLAWVGIL